MKFRKQRFINRTLLEALWHYKWGHIRIKVKVAIFLIAIMTLFLGMGTAAFLIFLVLFPVGVILSTEDKDRWKCIFYLFSGVVAFFIVMYIISASNLGIGVLVKHRLMILETQLHFLTNIEGAYIVTEAGSLNTSFPKIYKQEAIGYWAYIYKKPSVLMVGEGMGAAHGYGYPRGGDLALIEYIVSFGVPLCLLLLICTVHLIINAFPKLVSGFPSNLCKAYLFFAILVIMFIFTSLGHYNVLFKKEILPIFLFALGLLRRFADPSITVITFNNTNK